MATGSKIVTPLKVGILVAGAFTAFAVFLQIVSTRGATKKGYHVWAIFDDVLGLEKKSPVQIAGIDVGAIDSVELVEGKAKVTLLIHPEIALFEDAKIQKVSISLLGDYKLRLEPGGAPGKAKLVEGGQIKDVVSLSDTDAIIQEVKKSTEAIGALIRGQEGQPAPLQKIVEDVQGSAAAARNILDTVSHDIGGNTQKLSEILDNVNRFTKDLTQISAGKDQDVSAIIKDARAISASLKVTAESLQAIIAGKNEEDLQQSVKSLRQTIETLNRALESVASVADKIDRGEGTVGKLINDETVHEGIEDAVDSVNDVLGGISRLQTWVNLRSEFQFRGGAAKNYVQFTLMPKEDKSYIFEVVDDPRGVRETVIEDVETTSPEAGRDFQYRERRTTTTDTLTFSIMFAKRFYFLQLRFGIIEGTGGVGLNLYAWKDRLELLVDLNQFGIEARNPRVKALALAEVIPHVYIHGGVDDFLNTGTIEFFMGLGVRFSDEDLRTLFIAAPPLPR